MNDLIVDFPCCRQSTDQQSSASITEPQHSVRFSPTSEMVVFERHNSSDSSANSKIWYSGKDVCAMKAEYRRNIRNTHKRLSSGIPPTADYNQDFTVQTEAGTIEEVELFGMENMLTPRLVAKRITTRKEYVHSVLLEQSRQRYQKEQDVDRLSLVARQSSRWSTLRAHNVGLLQNRYSWDERELYACRADSLRIKSFLEVQVYMNIIRVWSCTYNIILNITLYHNFEQTYTAHNFEHKVMLSRMMPIFSNFDTIPTCEEVCRYDLRPG